MKFTFTLSNGLHVEGEVEIEWAHGPLESTPLAMDWDVRFGDRLRAVGPLAVYDALPSPAIRDEFFRRVRHFALENRRT